MNELTVLTRIDGDGTVADRSVSIPEQDRMNEVLTDERASEREGMRGRGRRG